jgi:two-component system response regulator RegA
MSDVRSIRSILVADDDELLLAGFRRGLPPRGIEVYTATSRDEALRLARTQHVDAALVDLQLGHDNGLDLMRDLRKLHPHMQLIMITGHHTTSNTVQAMRAGAFDVITKPFTIGEILHHIHAEGTGVDLAPLSLDLVIYEHVRKVLEDCDGNQSEAARRLKKPRSWLRRFLKRAAPKQ